jgi:flavin-binding protein dodecin
LASDCSARRNCFDGVVRSARVSAGERIFGRSWTDQTRTGASQVALQTGYLEFDPTKETVMTVARITEISSISPKSFEDAIVQGIERANKTLKNLKGAWVKDQEVQIDNGRICGYKVILKVTFVLTE